MPLIDIESGREITRIPYRETFDLLRARLSDAEFKAMVDRVNVLIGHLVVRRGATMSHMERVGIRELRRDASGILRRVAAGETVEVSDRGRTVAVLTRAAPDGLARLEREGLLRSSVGDLLDVAPVALPPGAAEPSPLVSAGREP